MKANILFHASQRQPQGMGAKGMPDEPALYEFKVAGSISGSLAAWFDGLELAGDKRGNTILRGAIVDQAALHGVLTKIRDLHLILLSVTRK